MIFKTSIKYLFMVAALAIGFQSCSSDDDDNNGGGQEVEKTAAELVAGTYSGYSSGASKYFSGMIGANESVAISANSDGTVDLAYTTSTWGNTTLSNIAVTSTSDGYSLSGSGKYTMTGMSGTASEYDCNVSGTISTDKSTYSIVFSLPSVMGGFTITFQNGEPTAAQLLNGNSYEGYSIGNCAYFQDMVGQGEVVAFTGNEDGTVTIAYTSSTWGEATFSNLTVTKDGSNYVISGSSKYSMGHAGAVTEYDCEVSATVSSDFEDCTMTVSLPSVMGGLTINFEMGAPDPGLVLAGTYSGWSSMSSGYFSGMNYDNQSLTISSDMIITYNSDDLGSCEIACSKTTTEESGDYTFEGEGEFNMPGMDGTTKAYACTMAGTISADKSTYTIVFTLPSVMNGTTITFKNGSAPATEE